MSGKICFCIAFIFLLHPDKLFAQDLCMPVGWATQNGGVTGGGTVSPTIVTSYAELKTAITTASVKVVHVSGVITIPSGVRISFQDQSGKTIYGLPGCKLISNDLTRDGSGILYVKNSSNLIFRNLTFEGPAAYDTDGWDNMTIDNCTNVWVDHCEFQDGMDGNLDIKNAADFVSVTWCKFLYNKAPIPGGSGGSNDHRFTNLFGSSDGATGDRGKLRITLQNCWWAQGCKARMPRVRFGKVHVVNNLFNSTASAQCVMAGFEADLLIESNVFENVSSPIDFMSNTFTAITARNNIFTNTTGNTAGSGTSFTPPYSLSVVPVANVKNQVIAGAGATLGSSGCDTAAPVIYPLNTISAPLAGGTISGGGNYYSGTTVTLTATPLTGYFFTGWTGDASGTGATTSIFMNGAKSVTANFQLSDTGTSGPNIRIEDDATAATGLCLYDGVISTNSSASNGKVINLANASGKAIEWRVATPSGGDYSLNWRYVNSSNSNAYSMKLVINGIVSDTALPFSQTANSTTFSNTGKVVVLTAGNNSIRLETTASAATADIDWLEITGSSPSAANCSGSVVTYTLAAAAVPVTGGSVSGAGNYVAGTIVTLTATPSSGYIFTGWSGDVTGTNGSISVTMNGNKTVTANFVTAAYTLTGVASPAHGGTVSGSGVFSAGSTTALTATAAPGYIFTGWSGDLSGTTNPATVTMNAAKNITAVFITTATIATTPVSIINNTLAISGGTVSADGGAGVTERGIVFGLTLNPTTADTKLADAGTGTGTFTSSLSGFAVNTIYHVRAYAINAAGINYGNDVTFSVSSGYPTIPATNIVFTAVGPSSMTIGFTPGNGTKRIVLVKAGSSVNAGPVSGVNYSASTVMGAGSEIGTGNFVVYNGSGNEVTITGLLPGTVYYAAVYEYNLGNNVNAINYLQAFPARGN